MNHLPSPSLSRFDVYQTWRAACEAVAVLREVVRGRSSVVVAARVYAQFAADYDKLRGPLSTASPPLLQTIEATPRRLDRAVLDALERVAQDLGTLALDGSRVRLHFAPHRAGLAVERAVLDAALALDSAVPLGELIDMWQLAGTAHVDIADTRCVACQWCDEGLVYMSRTRITTHAAEGVLLLDAARQRAERWDAYQRSVAPDLAPASDVSGAPANNNRGALAPGRRHGQASGFAT